MAAVTKLAVSVFGHSTPAGSQKKFSDNKEILTCQVACTWQGTYASANDANVLALTTDIQNSRRDGRTVALYSAKMAAPGKEAGVVIGATTVAVSGTGLTLVLTQADGTTRRADGAMSAFDEPVVLDVTYTLAAQ
jgi:hypothetical protein